MARRLDPRRQLQHPALVGIARSQTRGSDIAAQGESRSDHSGYGNRWLLASLDGPGVLVRRCLGDLSRHRGQTVAEKSSKIIENTIHDDEAAAGSEHERQGEQGDGRFRRACAALD